MQRAFASAATACVAAGALLLTLALTRIYGLLLPANAAFFSLAAAGSGAAVGALIAHRAGWLPRRRVPLLAEGAALGGGAAVVAVVFAVGLAAVGSLILDTLFTYLAFVGIGVALAGAYTASPSTARSLFAAQLLGGALAAVGSTALLDTVGPVDCALLAALLVALGSVLHASQAVLARRVRGPDEGDQFDESPALARLGHWAAIVFSAVAAIVALAAFPSDLAGRWLTLDVIRANSEKSLFASVQDPSLREQLVYSAWDATGRTDVTQPATSPDARWLYRDGSIAGLMTRTGSSGASDVLRADVGNVPYELPGSHDKVLVIGSATGSEVLLALAAGATDVVAADVPPGALRAVQADAGFSGAPFLRPGVRVVPQEGRAFLRSTREQFDMIYLSVGGTGVAQIGGASSGNYLYTQEAFADYLDHLRDDGRLVLQLRDEEELTRAFNMAFQAFTRRGASPVDAIRRLIAVNNQPLSERTGGGVIFPVLTARKTPYSSDEAKAASDTLQQTPYQPLFLPYQEGQSPLGGFAVDEVGPRVIEASAPYDIHPATDSSPFFFETDKGFPWLLIALPLLAAVVTGLTALFTRRPGADAADPLDPERELGEGVTAFLDDDVPWRFVGFAALIGAGFALLVLPLLHRLPVLMGDESLVAPVVLGTLLAGGAVGALLGPRGGPATLRQAIGWAALVGVVLSIAQVEITPMVQNALRDVGVVGRCVVVAGMVTPLGVCLGIPFPAAVRILDAAGRGAWAALLWAAAALAAMTGLCLALAFGLGLSFSYALSLAAVCLFVAFMIAGLRWLSIEAEQRAVETPDERPEWTQFQRPTEPSAAVETPSGTP